MGGKTHRKKEESCCTTSTVVEKKDDAVVREKDLFRKENETWRDHYVFLKRENMLNIEKKPFELGKGAINFSQEFSRDQ